MTIKELNLDFEAKQKLGIFYVNEGYLCFSSKRNELEIEKFSNGEITFELSYPEERLFFRLNKDQVETLIKWLNEKAFA